MKLRPVLSTILLIIFILSLIGFIISRFVQPILPLDVNSDLLLAVTVFSGLLEVLPNLTELIDFALEYFYRETENYEFFDILEPTTPERIKEGLGRCGQVNHIKRYNSEYPLFFFFTNAS